MCNVLNRFGIDLVIKRQCNYQIYVTVGIVSLKENDESYGENHVRLESCRQKDD